MVKLDDTAQIWLATKAVFHILYSPVHPSGTVLSNSEKHKAAGSVLL